MFGDEFGDLGLMGGDFGGGMDDIEVPRAKSITFADDKDITEKSNMQVCINASNLLICTIELQLYALCRSVT